MTDGLRRGAPRNRAAQLLQFMQPTRWSTGLGSLCYCWVCRPHSKSMPTATPPSQVRPDLRIHYCNPVRHKPRILNAPHLGPLLRLVRHPDGGEFSSVQQLSLRLRIMEIGRHGHSVNAASTQVLAKTNTCCPKEFEALNVAACIVQRCLSPVILQSNQASNQLSRSRPGTTCQCAKCPGIAIVYAFRSAARWVRSLHQ